MHLKYNLKLGIVYFWLSIVLYYIWLENQELHNSLQVTMFVHFTLIFFFPILQLR